MTRATIAGLLESGLTLAEAAKRLGLAKSTVSFHARKLGFAADARFALRYDWQEVQRYYDEGHSIRECARKYGFSTQTWHEAVQRGVLRSRPAAAAIETYLVEGRRVSRTHLKRRLFDSGLKINRCERCGLSDWRGDDLSMALHHINGDGWDNRLENLELLCPNCHSQTPNFAGRNIAKRRRIAQMEHAGSSASTPTAEAAAGQM